MSTWTTKDLVGFVQQEFASLPDPAKAGPMAAYMKTNMPFYGIQKPERIPVYKAMKKAFAPQTRKQYCAGVLALWKLPHREEKYAALDYAKQHNQFVDYESFSLYETLIREGAWWDFVDDVATQLVSEAYLIQRKEIAPTIEKWTGDSDMWIRRTAILAHNHHKDKTDHKQLFAHVLKQCHEEEFFIRKAIGWALREYSYADPDRVRSFLVKNKDKLSTLSFREASKQLAHGGTGR